jgi:hypothetical protein
MNMKTQNASVDPIKIFYSYSHQDETYAKELDKYLITLKHKKIISTWYDRKIGAGEEWKKKIDDELNSAHIILLLISIDFMNSEYCYDKELTMAMLRNQVGAATIIPVILRKIPNIEDTPFSKFQSLPKDGKPIDHWDNKEDAWVDVAEGIAKHCKSIMKERSKKFEKVENVNLPNPKNIVRTVVFKEQMNNQKREMDLWKMSLDADTDPELIIETRNDVKIAQAEISDKLFEKWGKFMKD